jgi:hypothetical protein
MHDLWAHVKHSTAKPETPAALAADGSASIARECTKESFANVRKGMIAGETGLHEDVFELRQRSSLVAIPFGLNETLRLEALLRTEATASGRSKQQADCLLGFSDHLTTLTDPILERDRLQKEIDVSALNDATKEIQEQAEKKPAGAADVPLNKPQ